VQNAKLTQNESGIKPPHSKKGSKLLLGGSMQNKNGIKDIGLDKQKLNTPGQTCVSDSPARECPAYPVKSAYPAGR
jgi:hypothetical protein